MTGYPLTPIHIKAAASEGGQSLADFHIGFTQLGNGLVHCGVIPEAFCTSFRELTLSKILSLTMAQFYGGRSNRKLIRSMSQQR